MSTTKDEILATALRLFLSDGYEATTTRAIAAQLGITPAALYYHFPSKADCLAELLEPYLQALEAMLAEIDDQSTEAILAAYLNVLFDHTERARLIDVDIAASRDPAVGPRLERATGSLRRALVGPNPSRVSALRASAALGALRRPVLLFGALTKDADIVLEAAVAALGRQGRR